MIPHLEPLESRDVPTTLTLDFWETGYGGFRSLFRRDGKALRAAERIAANVRVLLAPFPAIDVVVGDVLSDAGTGETILNEGGAYVVFVAPEKYGDGVLGEAIGIARPDSNFAGPAWVYAGNLPKSVSPRKHFQRFCRETAEIAVHEFGHLLGLQHSSWSPEDIMTSSLASLRRANRFTPEEVPEIIASLSGSQDLFTPWLGTFPT